MASLSRVIKMQIRDFYQEVEDGPVFIHRPLFSSKHSSPSLQMNTLLGTENVVLEQKRVII